MRTWIFCLGIGAHIVACGPTNYNFVAFLCVLLLKTLPLYLGNAWDLGVRVLTETGMGIGRSAIRINTNWAK